MTSRHRLASLSALALALAACGGGSSSGVDVSGDDSTAPPLPALGALQRDPSSGNTLVRLSDSQVGPRTDFGHITKSDYSRIQAENADGSRLLVLATNARQLLQYALLDPRGGEPVFVDLPPDNVSGLAWLHDETEARWHPDDPARLRFIRGRNSYLGGLQVFEYDLEREAVTLLADLNGKLPPRWGAQLYGSTELEGGYSDDGNRLAWAVESGVDHAETLVGYVAFDLRDGGRVLGTLDADGRDHDHLGISPSGEHVVISGHRKTTVHPVDFSAERVIMRESQHSDFCRTRDGRDCYISASFNNADDPHYGWVFVHELASGQSTRLYDIFAAGNTSVHFSGRAFDRPGWALMSTYNCQSRAATAKCNRLTLVELAANPRLIDLASTHSSGADYFAEPQASISRDGERAYFNSDWQRPGVVDLFRVDIPPALYADN